MSRTLSNIYNDLSFALSLHTKAMARLQEQASTGSRINRASDDPSAAYRVLGLNSQERSLQNYIDSIDETMSTLEISLSVIGNLMNAVTNVETSITQVMGGIYGQNQRETTADMIDDTLEQIVSLANTRYLNQYLFGGSDTVSAPYVVERTAGEITSVTYQGSSEQRSTEVAPGVETSAFYVGDNIFRSDNRSTPVFYGDTGVGPGTGTSSVRGDVWLTVTFEGSDYKLSIDDGATTVVADGSANQAVTDSQTGRVLYVDTTGITNTGVDLVRVPGTYDIFNTLISIRDMLRNERGFSEAELAELVNKSLSSLEEVKDLLVTTQVSMGAKIEFLNNTKGTIEDIKFDTSDEAVLLQEADITQIAIDLSRREVLYQMSLSVAAKLMSMSLLDFME